MITGGAGFIGSSLVRFLADEKNIKVLNIDKLTYAGNLESLSKLENKDNHIFFNIDINQQEEIQDILFDEKPNFIMHLAAESHVTGLLMDQEILLIPIFLEPLVF